MRLFDAPAEHGGVDGQCKTKASFDMDESSNFDTKISFDTSESFGSDETNLDISSRSVNFDSSNESIGSLVTNDDTSGMTNVTNVDTSGMTNASLVTNVDTSGPSTAMTQTMDTNEDFFESRCSVGLVFLFVVSLKKMSRPPPPRDRWTQPEGLDFNARPPYMACCVPFMGAARLIVVLLASALGIMGLWRYPEARVEFPWVFWYVVLALLCDAAVNLSIGLVLGCIGVCYGESSVATAMSGLAVVNQGLLMLVQWISCGFGIYISFRDGPALYEAKHIDSIPLLAFLFAETLLSGWVVLRSLPSVIGILNYAVHKIHHKVTRQPVVQFLTGYHPVEQPFYHYPDAVDYEMSLARLGGDADQQQALIITPRTTTPPPGSPRRWSAASETLPPLPPLAG